MIMLYGFFASAWNIIGGFAGQVSLGHAAFAGISAYVSTLLFINAGLTPWIGMLAGGAIAALVSALFGLPCFKLRGTYYTLATIAFAETIRFFMNSTEKIAGIEIKGASGLVLPIKGNAPALFQFFPKTGYYYVILIMLIFIIVFCFVLKHSKIGYYFQAIREDHASAEALGISPLKYKLIAAALSGFFTGLGGTFYAQYILYIEPAAILGLDLSVSMVIMSVIGGSGTVLGPVLGSLFLTPLAELTRLFLGSSFAGAHRILYGLILAIVVIFMPKGFEPLLRRFGKFLMAKKTALIGKK